MTMFAAWVGLPLVLAVLTIGCGLLTRRLTGFPVPGALLPAVGLAVVIVTTQFLTLLNSTAELATPAAVALAVAGFGVWGIPRMRSVEPWALIAALSVFAVYAAPIVLSGDPTFAGYIRLDDTATWMALTDQAMERGRDLDGLAPSTYEATLEFNLGDGYPVGVFLPLGVAAQLLGTDVAWLVQPYMAFLGVLLALALWELARPLLPQDRLRALVVFLGAQSALLVGYYLWGGIKEMAAAALIPTIAALAGLCVRNRMGPGPVLVLALACSALIGVLSVGGGLWLAPILLAALVVSGRMLGPRALARPTVTFIGVTVVLCLPVLIPGGLLPPTSSPLTSETAQGNLFEPLQELRLFGIWPAGDFRADPVDSDVTYVLIAIAAGAALLGMRVAVRLRALPCLLYVAGAVVAALVLVVIGSPWVEGKALATASPALLFAAALGAAWLYARDRRVEGGLLLVVLAGGVLWSNALAYRDVNLAPHDQLAELEEIGEEIEGEGPTLMTEYQPYGARHFLRAGNPEAASELRRNRVPKLDGEVLDKGQYADTDELQLQSLTAYRTLVLRRSPAQSRPPAPYELTWRDEYYEVWQRDPGEMGLPAEHLGLGSVVDPAGLPRCGEVLGLAERAGRDGTLAAVAREPVVIVPLQATSYPRSWVRGGASSPVPDSPGTIEARAQIETAGRYEVWLGGSVRPRVELLVDGVSAGSVRHQLNNLGQYVRLGETSLESGSHSIEVRFDDADLSPGSGGAADPIGPLVLSGQAAGDTEIVEFGADDARALCGQRWDWIASATG